MIPALHDLKLLGLPFPIHSIDETVFARDAARPPSGKRMLKRLRFPEPFKWISSDIFDQIINGVEDPWILVLPLDLVFPGRNSPTYLHVAEDGSIGSRSVSLPSSAS